MDGRGAWLGGRRYRGRGGDRCRVPSLAVEEEVRMMMRSLAFAAAILLAGSAVALAQVPPEIAAQTRAAGQTMDPASGTPYAALFPPEAWEGVTVERDVAYGP